MAVLLPRRIPVSEPVRPWERYHSALARRRALSALNREALAALKPALSVPGALRERCCPVCALDSAAFAFRAPLLDFYRCSGCALLYARHIPAGGMVERICRRSALGERMRALRAGGEGREGRLVSALLAVVPRTRAVLEIGSGPGQLLAALAPHFDHASVMERPPACERFDLIVLDQVLACAAQPAAFVASARALLAPDGVIFAGVPNGEAAALRFLRGRHPAVALHLHLNLFGPAALRHLAWRAGLQVRRLWTEDPWDGALSGALARRQAGAELCAILDAPPCTARRVVRAEHSFSISRRRDG